MKISFLIPAFNAEKTIEKAVLSFIHIEGDVQKDLIIIDDGSTDRTNEIATRLSAQYPEIRLISKNNGGEASALNAGLAIASGEFIALTESDVVLSADWLIRLLPAFADPSVFGVGGRLVTSRSEPLIARLAGYEIENKFEQKERYPGHITSANALYRREIFEKIGKFNEALVNASLDSDFNQRIIQRGYRLAYVKEAVAFHHYKTTLVGFLSRQYAYSRYRVFVPAPALYPSDRFLMAQVATTGLVGILAVLKGPFSIWTMTLFLFLIGSYLPEVYKTFRRTGDPSVVVYPFIALLRNVVAIAGYMVGFIQFRLFHGKKRIHGGSHG